MKLRANALLAVAGLCAALSVQAATEITEKARKQGMEGAPPLVATAAVPCTVTDAYKLQMLTKSVNGVNVPAGPPPVDTYEVSCQEGLGYVVMAARKDQKPLSYLCIEALDASSANSRPTTQCVLPGNQGDAQRAAVGKLMSKSSLVCELDRWRGIGHTSNKTLIEVACKNGDDQVLMAPFPLVADPPQLQAMPCLATALDGTISCQLVERAALLSAVDALFNSESGHACEISDRRYMVTTTTGDNYYEVLCKSGAGFVMSRQPSGKAGTTVECSAKLANDLGGCKLGKPAAPSP
jgi:hypothetical protein